MQPHPYYAPRPPRPPSRWTGAIIAIAASLGGIVLVATVVIGDRKDKARAKLEREEQIETCLRRGRWYYEEIGSWPTFSDGRDAATATLDHCQRDPHTFDGGVIRP